MINDVIVSSYANPETETILRCLYICTHKYIFTFGVAMPVEVPSSSIALYSFIFHLVFLPVGAFPL